MRAMKDEAKALREEKAAKKAAFDAEYDVGERFASAELFSQPLRCARRHLILSNWGPAARCVSGQMPSKGGAGTKNASPEKAKAPAEAREKVEARPFMMP